MSATLSEPRVERAPAGIAPPAPAPAGGDGSPPSGRWRPKRRHVEAAVVLALVGVAALLRLWDIHGRPGIDWDEPVYTDVARSFATGHGLEAKVPWDGVAQPYLFHPPFYFLLLAGWMRLLGSYEIGDARVLAALASLVVLVQLYALLRPRWGMTGAGLATLVLATDGWLVFTNRVGWIENTMLVLLVGGLLVYDRAVRRDATRLFVAAGLLLGAAVAYKHIAIFGLGVVAVHWALTRGRRRGHLALFAVVGGLLGVYVAVMLVAFAQDGRNWFADDSWVQVERLLGTKASRGSVSRPDQALAALVGPYKIFVTTFAIAGIGALLVAWRTVVGLVRWDLPRRVADPLLFSWALVAILFFAGLRLKMGHYFVMAQVPLMLYAFAELARWSRGVELRTVARRTVAALALLVVAANLWTFEQRFVERTDDALGQTRAYAQTLDPRAMFLTEESVGTIVPQPYCKLFDAGGCVAEARYLAIYRSETQAPPRNPTLDRLLRYSQPLVRFSGFKERITVYSAAGAGPICQPALLGVGQCRLDPAVRRWSARRARGETVTRVSFGDYRDLNAQRQLPQLAPLRDTAGRPWAVLLGVGPGGVAAFANLGDAAVSGDAHCRPSPADCQVLLLRERQAAHLELPRIDGRTTALELKLRAIGPSRRDARTSARGAALLRAATTPRTLTLDTSRKETTP
jgi:4-amino-4-deoxy-L-arabinose transferase-like glycosyltransferase